MTDTATATSGFKRGDAVYARRAGNAGYYWYVIDHDRPMVGGLRAAIAHRERRGKGSWYAVFADVRHHDKVRWVLPEFRDA